MQKSSYISAPNPCHRLVTRVCQPLSSLSSPVWWLFPPSLRHTPEPIPLKSKLGFLGDLA